MKNPNSINKYIREKALKNMRARGWSEKQCRKVLAASFKELVYAWHAQFGNIQ